MKILDPVGTAATAQHSLAHRPGSLQGAVVGLLDNSKPNAGVLLARLGDELRTRFGARDVRVWRKPGASVPATAAFVDQIAASCDVVLTGSAD